MLITLHLNWCVCVCVCGVRVRLCVCVCGVRVHLCVCVCGVRVRLCVCVCVRAFVNYCSLCTCIHVHKWRKEHWI